MADTIPRGIDVASHQGTVDWQAVARSGISFAFTKATGGAWYTNPTLAANWRGMKAAGIKRGAYHFAFESSGSPGGDADAEADFFLAAIEPLGLEVGDMLALDFEDGSGQLGQWALRWLTRIEKATGILPLIYTGAWFSVPHGFGTVPELAHFPLWLAAYQETLPAPPAPWQSIAFWQHDDKGTVPGVVGNCDLNLFNGPAEVLALYGKLPPPGSVIAPPTTVYAPPGSVGTGILEMMVAHGTEPAMPSTFLPLGRSPALIEEGQGMDGRIYRYHLPSGKLWIYEPAA